MKEQRGIPVKVSNQVITARYDFTALELNILMHIVREVQNSQYCQITVPFSVLQEGMGESHRNTTLIRKACMGLLSKPMELYDNIEDRWFAANFISSSLVDAKRSQITFGVDAYVSALLLDLKTRYTVIQLEAFLKLQSKYAKRLYLMCSQFRKTGVLHINIDELHTRLKTDDKPAYDKFSQFCKRVIDAGISEINELTDLTVMREPGQRGRPTDKVTFRVSSNIIYNKSSIVVPADEKQEAAAKYMRSVGLIERQIKNVLRHADSKTVYETLYRHQAMRDTLKNPAAYLATMFRQVDVDLDYGHAQQKMQLTNQDN